MKNFLNGLKNFKNTLNQVDQAGGVTSFLGGAIKSKFKMWLATAFVSAIPVIIPLFAVIIILAVVLAPFMSFFGGNNSRLDESGKEIRSPELQAFVDVLEERKEYWEDRGVAVDMNLVLAFIYYGDPDAANIECTQEELEDCFEEKKLNYKALEKEAVELIDNMIYKNMIYTCTETTVIRKNQCQLITETLPSGQVIVQGFGDCDSTATTRVADPKVCGSDSTCNNVCFKIDKPQSFEDKTVCAKDDKGCLLTKTMSFTVSEEDVYMLKTKAEYDKWIKENYIEDKLRSIDVAIPNEGQGAFFDSVIEEVYSIRNAFAVQDITYLQGETISGSGKAGAIPQEMLDILVSPLGTQPCRQTGCFGFYGPNNCNSHAGVDIGNNGGNPLLYAVAPGKVVAINRSGINCRPVWTRKPICFYSQCPAGIVTLEHEIMIDGKVEKFYSKYVHLDSVAPNLMIGSTVASGEFIGVMGDTGCSSATHLHFELLSGKKQTYNPEEFLYAKGCTPYREDANVCIQARNVCSGGRW